MLRTNNVRLLDDTACAPDLRPTQRRRGGTGTRAPHSSTRAPHLIVRRSACETMFVCPNETRLRFFSPVQAHMAESAQFVSGATNTPSQSAMKPSYGTAHQEEQGKMSRAGWLPQAASCFASTGNSQGVVGPPATQTGTSVPDVGRQTMEPKAALEQRGFNPLTPYAKEAWADSLSACGLGGRYPSLVQSLADGFDVGIPRIRTTYSPPNHSSVHLLPDVYNSIVDSEFKAGRYIRPFTQKQVESAIGPFQTSPLSLVPKTSKPGVYWAVHNFSHPYNPSNDTTSINSQINGNNFPCTWGTFSTVALLISCLPPRSQASICDVADAYRTIPIIPAQWPGLIVCLQADDQFAINTCNNFSLTSAGGVYGALADAGADIFRGEGMGPLTKWVDDHIFFRVPRTHLPGYNV